MSPKNKKKLHIIRKKLDSLDNQFLDLIKKRTNLINIVIKLKNKKSEIVDKKRINIILKNVKKKSIKRKIDTNLTFKIWKSIIWSFISYEKIKFKKK